MLVGAAQRTRVARDELGTRMVITRCLAQIGDHTCALVAQHRCRIAIALSIRAAFAIRRRFDLEIAQSTLELAEHVRRSARATADRDEPLDLRAPRTRLVLGTTSGIEAERAPLDEALRFALRFD